MTKEPAIPIAELPYPHKVTEDSDEDENDWVPRPSQASHGSSQDQGVDGYTRRVESTQHNCETALDLAQGQLLTLEYMLDPDNLQGGSGDSATPGGVGLGSNENETTE